ncbi:MAG: branched-chain amino acid ABC transporter permease [Chloroflexi bacterium]|nr:branched-chain amino acid ABC transporter permease [Chloroflexota bacterium]
METLVQQLLDGLMIGAAYALMAVGLTIIFGLMDVVNFAHGEFYMLGAFVVFQLVGLQGLNYFLAVLLAVAAVGLLGVIVQRTLIRRVRQSARLNYLYATSIVTIGLSIFLQNAAQLVWGAVPKAIPQPFPVEPIILGSIAVSPVRLFILVASMLVIATLALWLKRTLAGRMIRATFQDREAAALIGLPVDRIDALAFGGGTMLAALAGVLLGSAFQVYPTMGGLATLKAFTVVILGGMGSFPGAIAGGFVLGVSESLAAGYLSAGLKDAIGFAVVIAVLMFRPTGLLPAVRRVR